MARCCGSQGTCACKIVAGRQVEVSGTGTAQDPFVIDALATLQTQDTAQFRMVLGGAGTLDNPWTLSVIYADSASLDGLPDVTAPSPTNGQVLTYDGAQGQWVPAAPVTATPGAVLTGNGVEGDGSAGTPLEVTADEARYITVTTSGVGLTDDGINRLVRIYADSATRDADTAIPASGSLSILQTDPGRVDYWNGADWLPIENGINLAIQTGQLMQLSGAYVIGRNVFQWVDQLSFTTDVNGDFEVLSATDLTNYAGVLTVHVQETGTTPYKAVVRPTGTSIVGTAYRLDDGTPYAGVALTAVLTAMLY